MSFIGEVVGFVRAWVEVMALEVGLLLAFIGFVLYATRRRSGRRRVNPSHPDLGYPMIGFGADAGAGGDGGDAG